MQGGHALVALYTEGSMPLHKVTCMPRGHALGIVRCRHVWEREPSGANCAFSRDRLTADEPASRRRSHFGLDEGVPGGHRCRYGRAGCRRAEYVVLPYTYLSSHAKIFVVYGTDQVTSGCSSDLRQATSTATEMVKVRLTLISRRRGYTDQMSRPVYRRVIEMGHVAEDWTSIL